MIFCCAFTTALVDCGYAPRGQRCAPFVHGVQLFAHKSGAAGTMTQWSAATQRVQHHLHRKCHRVPPPVFRLSQFERLHCDNSRECICTWMVPMPQRPDTVSHSYPFEPVTSPEAPSARSTLTTTPSAHDPKPAELRPTSPVGSIAALPHASSPQVQDDQTSVVDRTHIRVASEAAPSETTDTKELSQVCLA